MQLKHDEPRTIFPVKLDGLTTARLMKIADIAHASPSSLIAAIVHDVLEDDARMHQAEFTDLKSGK